MNAAERLLGRKEVAERLGLSPLTVGHMMREGKLPAFKMGRLWRVREADLDDYVRDLARGKTTHD
jgi:excisionase family DNA binding protein